MKNLHFNFGALNDSFSKQCENQGIKLQNVEKWDKILHCTYMLHIHGILTDGGYKQCLDRIVKFAKSDMSEVE